MKNILIVFSHAEPKSFCGAMKSTITKTLEKNGYNVKISDLYDQKYYDPLGPKDFKKLTSSTYFQPQVEQVAANKDGKGSGFIDESRIEQEKLKWCDLLILIYPIYWFTVPGITKNWIDRTLSDGFAYSETNAFENGLMKGKKAMAIISTGAPQKIFEKMGVWNSINDHINKCIFGFCGFTPLKPYYAFSAAHIDDKGRKAYLAELETLFANPNKIEKY